MSIYILFIRSIQYLCESDRCMHTRIETGLKSFILKLIQYQYMYVLLFVFIKPCSTTKEMQLNSFRYNVSRYRLFEFWEIEISCHYLL